MEKSEGQFEEDDEELWAKPEPPSPFIAFLNDPSRPHYSIDVHAWNELNPSEQAPYISQTAPLTQKFEAEVRAFNARIPLSPLIDTPRSNQWDAYVFQERFRKRGAQLWNRYRRDHPLACGGGAIVPVAAQPFRFLALPNEIRAMILRTLLHRPMPLQQMEANGTAIDYDPSTDAGPVDVRVFVVSKQLHAEATDAFFAANTIVIDLGANSLPPLLRAAGNPLVAKIRRLQIRLPLYRIPEAARLAWMLQRLCSILLASQASLTELMMVPVSPTSWYKREMHDVMDRVVLGEGGGLMELVRGVKRVGFVWEDDVRTMQPCGGAFLTDKVVLGTEGMRRQVREAVGRG
ncbi:MAG: hypothetical protein Q9177_002529 [Variospora cf. flavescens]